MVPIHRGENPPGETRTRAATRWGRWAAVGGTGPIVESPYTIPGMTALSGLSKLGVAAGLAGLAIAVAGPASADDLNTTTCSEQQVMSSIQQNDPMIWGKINSDPKLEQELRVGLDVVLVAPPGQRQQLVTTLEQTLGKQQFSGISDDIMNSSTGPIGRAVNDCHKY